MSPGSLGPERGSEPLAVLPDALRRLGLTTLAAALPQLLETARAQQWTYDVFLQQAVGAEVQGRAQRAYERRVRAAHLPGSALSTSLESFDFGFQPSLSAPLIRELATLGFVQTATNIVLLGPPGVGKTHLALALPGARLGSGVFGAVHHAAPARRRARDDQLAPTTPAVFNAETVGH